MGTPSVEKRDRLYRAILVASVGCTLLLLLTSATFWSLVGFITIFLAPFVLQAVWIALGGVALCALGLALFRHGRPLRIWAPLAICAIGGALGHWVPFTDIWLSANYHLHRRARHRVASAFEAGQLPLPTAHDSTMVVHLPWAASASNGGGDVLISRGERGLSVLFFTYRGILSHYSGYLYRTDTLPTPPEVFGDRVCEAEPVESHWSFVAFC